MKKPSKRLFKKVRKLAFEHRKWQKLLEDQIDEYCGDIDGIFQFDSLVDTMDNGRYWMEYDEFIEILKDIRDNNK